MHTDAIQLRPQFPFKKPVSVCIVGAGVAGLRCADVLLSHGFDVTILEARDRIGGRVTQTKLSSGHSADLGANWIHGTVSNPIMDLAKATGTQTHDWYVYPEIVARQPLICSYMTFGSFMSRKQLLIFEQG